MTEIHFPERMTGYELDDYLSRGWYRMWQFIFTTNQVEFKGIVYEVFWLRIALSKVNYGKSQKKILVRNNGFLVAVKPCLVTPEIEELFDLYKTVIDFDGPESVAGYLLAGANHNIYNTQVIEIRDENKLIAAGFFDLGENSIAGILNFYHPEYKSKSLGIYLMLLKIDHAKKLGKNWYYPGYVVKNYRRFDYKLFPDIHATEAYASERKEWMPFSWPLLSGEAGNNTDNI